MRRVAGEEAARPLASRRPPPRRRGRGRSAVRAARCAPPRPSADTSAATSRGGGGCGPSSTGSTSFQAATSGPTSARYAAAVGAEAAAVVLERALEHGRRPVVEGVRGRRARVYPLDRRVEQPEDRARAAHRMHRGADVVEEARERQLRRARAAADLLLRLVDDDLEPGARKRHRAREPVRPRPDHDCPPHRGIRPAEPRAGARCTTSRRARRRR